MAVASSIAALTAVTLLISLAGRDAVATTTTAARVARAAVVLALPGLVLAITAPRLSRRGRTAVALALGLALMAVAVWRWEDGGVLVLPAAALAGVVAVPRTSRSTFATAASPARSDLVAAAAAAAVVGLFGRAVTLDAVNTTGLNRLSLVATGLVLLAWPLVGLALLPGRLRHRGLTAMAAALTAIVISQAPAGGEAWLTPAVVLLVVAAFVPAPDDEVSLGWF